MTWITAIPWQSTVSSTTRAMASAAVDEGRHGTLFAFRANEENMDGRGVDGRDSLRAMRLVHAIASPARIPPSCWVDGVGNPPSRDRIMVPMDKCRVVHLFRPFSRGACG
jgi:hypothetical protein